MMHDAPIYGPFTLRFDKDFPLDSWISLFHSSGYNEWWGPRNAEASLAHSYLVVTAWHDETMVGTLRVESDGVNFALIDDVVVHPAYRRQGIGSQMMRQTLDRLVSLDLVHIQLLPIPGRESFFARFGFVVQRGATVMDFDKPKR